MPESSFLSFSPWSSRSNTPKPNDGKEKPQLAPPIEGFTQNQVKDHNVPHRPRISLKDYPSDCPKSTVRWFYAVDVPKRKPLSLGDPKDKKPLPAPKKYSAFSQRDSRSIEQAFHRQAEIEQASQSKDITDTSPTEELKKLDSKKNTSINNASDKEEGGAVKVPVNEDFLFDVDIENRELAPAYWLGPIYDVRRGSWFFQDGNLRPCEENLAGQLEEGYLKVKPWRNPKTLPAGVAASGTEKKEKSEDAGDEQIKDATYPSIDPSNDAQEEVSVPAKFELQTQRLFGAYINSVVTFQDADTAWILTDDILSRMSGTIYQRFAGGAHLGGTKVVRGYKDTKDTEKPKTAVKDPKDQTSGISATSKIPDLNGPKPEIAVGSETNEEKISTPDVPRILKLERQMSNYVSSSSNDPAVREAALRERDEEEIKADYIVDDGQEQNREIEHLILVSHGIGQLLGLRMESVNFIHDVNVLRKTLKSVYQASPDLQTLNNEVDKLPKNCRIQVLPVVWRHLLDFPKKSFKQNREQDLTDDDSDEEYPGLESITVDGVPAIRQLISDLALDILLYQSAYREHIASIVRQESNRVYELFLARNPDFKGKVSLIGHSLGSAILFDILCRQTDETGRTSVSRPRRHSRPPTEKVHEVDLGLKFDVEDFYCLGSPIGLYQMLKGHLVRARPSKVTSQMKTTLDDPFSLNAATTKEKVGGEILSVGISAPKCGRLFNIFHPADPIAYRVEPLVSNAMSALKPQPLPYTKRGIFNIQTPGFSNIGTMVGQSVSGMWTNLTSGVASSLLNRSLGLTSDGQNITTQTGSPSRNVQKHKPTVSGDNLIPKSEAPDTADLAENPPTLLDSEKVTLFAEFERKRQTLQSDGSRDLGESSQWLEAEKRSKKLRSEEAKVRALNSNGRLDFSIQEGVFDISLIASIASHLSYWADEDVSHFIISQLLSRQRVIKR